MRPWLARAAALLALAGGAAACTTTHRITNTQATAVQQLLVTEAVDRAIDELTWPALDTQSVFVDIGVDLGAGLTADRDLLYVGQAVAGTLAHRGARFVGTRDRADYVVSVLVGALGTDQRNQFIGLPPIQSVILPISLPEIVVYKSERQWGFAKLEVVVRDREGGVVHRSGPARGETYWEFRQVPLASGIHTDTSRFLRDDEAL